MLTDFWSSDVNETEYSRQNYQQDQFHNSNDLMHLINNHLTAPEVIPGPNHHDADHEKRTYGEESHMASRKARDNLTKEQREASWQWWQKVFKTLPSMEDILSFTNTQSTTNVNSRMQPLKQQTIERSAIADVDRVPAEFEYIVKIDDPNYSNIVADNQPHPQIQPLRKMSNRASDTSLSYETTEKYVVRPPMSAIVSDYRNELEAASKKKYNIEESGNTSTTENTLKSNESKLVEVKKPAENQIKPVLIRKRTPPSEMSQKRLNQEWESREVVTRRNTQLRARNNQTVTDKTNQDLQDPNLEANKQANKPINKKDDAQNIEVMKTNMLEFIKRQKIPNQEQHQQIEISDKRPPHENNSSDIQNEVLKVLQNSGLGDDAGIRAMMKTLLNSRNFYQTLPNNVQHTRPDPLSTEIYEYQFNAGNDSQKFRRIDANGGYVDNHNAPMELTKKNVDSLDHEGRIHSRRNPDPGSGNSFVVMVSPFNRPSVLNSIDGQAQYNRRPVNPQRPEQRPYIKPSYDLRDVFGFAPLLDEEGEELTCDPHAKELKTEM